MRLVQSEFTVDGTYFGRPNQAGMRNGHRMQRSFKCLERERQKPIEHGELWAEIIVLPNKGLQQGGMIRKPIENLSRRQTIAFELAWKIFRCHRMPSDSDT